MSAVLTRHNVKVVGHGEQPMIFAHGFGCDQNMWRFITPAFQDRYKVILFDYVGHGQSDAAAFDQARYGSLQGYADDVLAICRELNLKDVIFVGHSVSAMIGVLAAIQEAERLDRLVLIGPSPRYMDDDDYVGGFKQEDIAGLLDSLDSNHLENLPGSEFVLMTATGHCPNLSAPEETIAAMEAFLRGSVPNKAAAE
ncbi:alpha/beta fold hydrolase [Microvirga sp. TS319]|uniref:alpha/beta fold hydrolase n=1 Tax=Microvirga sp. TS319 TaxID=3241165 RepID=UPI00351A7BA7